MLHETRFNPTTAGLSSSSGAPQRQSSSASASNAGSGRGGSGGTFFATDPSNPLNTRYFQSCCKSVELYLNALRRGHDKQHQQAAASLSSCTRNNEDPSNTSGDVIDKDNNKKDDDDDDTSPLVMPEDTVVDTAVLDHQVLEEITGHVDALKDLCSGPDAAFLTINNNNSDDGEDRDKENKTTREENCHGNSADANVSSSRKKNRLDVRQLGGGENVLTNASATFTLEQQMLQEAYHREFEEEDEDEEDEEEGDEGERTGTKEEKSTSSISVVSEKKSANEREAGVDIASSHQSKGNPKNTNDILEESRKLLTKSIVRTIAGLDPMDVSSSSCSSTSGADRIESILAAIGAQITLTNNSSISSSSSSCGGGVEKEIVESRGISIADVCEMFDTAMMMTGQRQGGKSRDSSNTVSTCDDNKKTEPAPPTEASSGTLGEENDNEEEERRLLAFFEREDPPESNSLMESQLFKVVGSMVRFAATVATHTVNFALQYPDVSVSSASSSPTNTTVVTDNNNNTNSPVVLASSSLSAASCSPPQLNESPVAASSSLSFSQSGGGVTAMKKRSVVGGAHPSPPHMNRHSSAIFDDCPSVRENLSEFTAQLLYHALSILCESMSVFKGNSEQDRVIEMIEFYVDRCENILLASVHASRTSAAGDNNSNISNESKNSSPANATKTRIGSLAPIRLTFRQQCVVAARRSVCLFLLKKIYPFRRRVQNLMAKRRNHGDTHHRKNMSGRGLGAASRTTTPAVDIIGSHLNLVFGRVSRPIELAWFAEGFRSVHMQLMANLSQNNRLVARALTNAPLYRDAFSSRKEGGRAAEKEEGREGEEVGKIEKKSEQGEEEKGQGGKPCAYTTFARESVANNGVKSFATHEGKVAGPSTAAAAVAPPDLFCSILQSTGLDPENPAIAEWSEFCVKCMCSVSLASRVKLEGLKRLVTSSSSQNHSGGDVGKYRYINTMETEDADVDADGQRNTNNNKQGGTTSEEVDIFMREGKATNEEETQASTTNAAAESPSSSPIEGQTLAAQSSAQQPNCYTPAVLLSPSAGNGNFASINGITERLDTWEQYEEAFM